MPDHLALPLRVAATGRLVSLAQDSDADVAQSVALLLSTRTGERLSVPTYGTPPALFGHQVNTSGLAAAVDAWEPRAGDYDLRVDTANPAAPVITVTLPAAGGTTIVTAEVAA